MSLRRILQRARIAAAALLLLWSAGVAADQAPDLLRFGATGPRFGADDIAQITRIANAAGGTPWILVGHPGFPPTEWLAQVFLEPDEAGDRVRRGRVVTLHADLEAGHAYDRPKTWRTSDTQRYAQIVVPGTMPGDVPNDRHFNRPFTVFGDVSDAELLEIETIIRRSPAVPSGQPDHPLAEVSSNTVHGTWPIGHVSRESSDAITVLLMLREGMGQSVRLHREGSAWRVTGLGAFIAGWRHSASTHVSRLRWECARS